jgi:LPLT family lysophospholipid transporter-like MFS transporter
VSACYFFAAITNTFIPRLPIARPDTKFQPVKLANEFFEALKVLLFNKDVRFSLIGTSIFWGAGSTLRLLLVAWVPIALGSSDMSLPANLSGAVAIGIAIGAFLAAKFVTLKNINRVLPAGLLIGIFIMLFAHATHLYATIVLLMLIGAAGGFYVVPLNALLQERGHETVGSGNAVAVQNFFENFCMLVLLGLFIVMEKNKVPIVTSTFVFGGIILLSVVILALKRLGQSQQTT